MRGIGYCLRAWPLEWRIRYPVHFDARFDETNMQAYQAYVDSVESFMASGAAVSAVAWRRQASLSLDGEPSRELRSAVALDDLRASGAFFTGQRLARRVVAGLWKKAKGQAVFFDPACGSGDLLLAVARKLPLCGTPQATVVSWGRLLAGCDVHPEFVRAAKLRLVLLALHRHGSREDLTACQNAFSMLKVADGLRERDLYKKADCIVMNPPFCPVECPAEVDWGSGKISGAAVFVTTAIAKMRNGAAIAAVLPDVLRSGTRYEKWRGTIENSIAIESTRAFGLFDKWADVDVFVLLGERTKQTRAQVGNSHVWWATKTPRHTVAVGSQFDIAVGPVVPHRHEHEGTKYPYIHARSVEPWRTLHEAAERRQFTGTVFTPPFVVVRRTSRPGDKHRAIAGIVKGTEPVAVENHLIVCSPKRGTVRECEALLRALRDASVDSWLDSRIRCRHLTVSALADLPVMLKP